MEQNSVVEHDTTLEHALDVARANVKEAKRLLDDARSKYAAGEVDEARVRQLESLMALANEDLVRVMKEN
jgi:outer membrane protein TolC